MHPSQFCLSRPAALALALALACLPGCAHKHKKDGTSGAAQTTAKASTQPVKQPFPINHEDWGKIGYRLDWVGFPFAEQSGDLGQVTRIHAFNDVLVAQDKNSTVSLLEASTGKLRWYQQLAGPLTKFVGINRDPLDANKLVISSESEGFILSVPNGNLLGRDRFSKVVNTEPVIEGNIAIFGTTSGEVVGEILGNSLKAWGFLSGAAIDANPVEAGNAVAVVSQAGDVMFFTSNGALTGRAHIFGGLDSNPVAEGTSVFMAGRDQSVWGFDTGGNMLWRHRTSYPLHSQPTVHTGVVYVDIPKEGLTAFEATSGKVLWANPNVQGTVIGVRGGRLLVNKGPSLVLLDPARGDIVERITVPNMAKLTLDKFVDGNLYAVSDKAIVAKFIPR